MESVNCIASEDPRFPFGQSMWFASWDRHLRADWSPKCSTHTSGWAGSLVQTWLHVNNVSQRFPEYHTKCCQRWWEPKSGKKAWGAADLMVADACRCPKSGYFRGTWKEQDLRTTFILLNLLWNPRNELEFSVAQHGCQGKWAGLAVSFPLQELQKF